MITPLSLMARLGSLFLVLMLAACSPAELLPPDYRLPDGSTYTGETEDGFFHGRGVQEYPNGSLYRGLFSHGYWEGKGELVSAHGWRYQGQFEKGEMQGQGRFERAGGTVIEGEFANGELVRGKETSPYGVYEGTFEGWLYHGEGRWTSTGGDRFTGEFTEGALSGSGEFFGADGQHYIGEFQDWQFHGEGVLSEPDGQQIEGFFVYGQPVGNARLSRRGGDGKVVELEGRWSGGEFTLDGDQSPEQAREATAERILAEDPGRLNEALAGLEPERPGVADVYFLGVGGDGSESVFGRDIRVARDGFERTLDIEGRHLLLLNDRDYAALPLATRVSVGKALDALDAKMNPDEDLLAVHLVSHGARTGALRFHQPGISLPDLSPDEFAAMLDNLKVRRKFIVVSACYSGHWLNRLKSDDTLIMVSAREDRASFGCGDDSQMTWFTKALYQNEGLALANPEIMFDTVNQRIRQWETEQAMAEDAWSHPQFFIGDGIRSWLQQNF